MLEFNVDYKIKIRFTGSVAYLHRAGFTNEALLVTKTNNGTKK